MEYIRDNHRFLVVVVVVVYLYCQVIIENTSCKGDWYFYNTDSVFHPKHKLPLVTCAWCHQSFVFLHLLVETVDFARIFYGQSAFSQSMDSMKMPLIYFYSNHIRFLHSLCHCWRCTAYTL